jgi:predicted nucleic acid-binding protein
VANSRRNQEHLGIDTNVLVAYLDVEHPSHEQTESLADRAVALNPTTIHEAYHTLVFKMKWTEEEASQTLTAAYTDEQNLFLNQTLRTTRAGLQIAAEHRRLGGRDALILANFLVGRIAELVTFDKSLLALGKVTYGKSSLSIKHP